MARFRNFIHSSNACTLVIEGNKSNPEPEHAIIKFPGGNVEVARTSSGTYWAHLTIDEGKHGDRPGDIVGSRIDYDYEGHIRNGIIDVPNHDQIRHVAIEIKVKDNA